MIQRWYKQKRHIIHCRQWLKDWSFSMMKRCLRCNCWPSAAGICRWSRASGGWTMIDGVSNCRPTCRRSPWMTRKRSVDTSGRRWASTIEHQRIFGSRSTFDSDYCRYWSDWDAHRPSSWSRLCCDCESDPSDSIDWPGHCSEGCQNWPIQHRPGLRIDFDCRPHV